MMRIHNPSFWNRPVDGEARDHANKVDFLLATIRAEDAIRAREELLAPRLVTAAAAAEAWLDGAPVSDQVRKWHRLTVELATPPDAPPVAIHWLHRHKQVSRVVAPHGGVAMQGNRVIYTPPIVDDQTLLICLHELGHVFDKSSGTLQREVAAWRWALARTPVWNRELWREMLRCIHSYTAGAELKDLPGVALVDELCSERTYREVYVRLWQQEVKKPS